MTDIELVKFLLKRARLHDTDYNDPDTNGPSTCCMMSFPEWEEAWQALGRISRRLESMDSEE